MNVSDLCLALLGLNSSQSFEMSKAGVTTALARVADILASSDYLQKEVLIIIPNIRLNDKKATEKVIRAPRRYIFSIRSPSNE